MDTVIRRRMLRRWRQRRANINRRTLRDASDPLALDSELFIKSYRVTKDLFLYLCSALSQFLGSSERCTGISTEVKILTALNFLGTGSYQKPVGRDWLAPVSQPTASRCIEEVVEALNHIFHTHVRFPTTDHEKNKIKQGFYEDHNFPGVLGCVDGTLVAILAPRNHPSEASFFSRKGYHAINAAIICDSKLRIIGVCAKFGGAAHDSHVWRSWSVSQYLEEEHRHGKVGWLLGDSGYPQKPWLMTPVLHAADNTPEAHYTNMHVRTRVCVEQCIGLLKARWRCLLRHRVLHYAPTKCAKIINACTVLHNLCLNDGIEIDRDDIHSIGSSLDSNDDPIEPIPSVSMANMCPTRQQLINTMWQNRFSAN